MNNNVSRLKYKPEEFCRTQSSEVANLLRTELFLQTRRFKGNEETRLLYDWDGPFGHRGEG